MTREEPEHLALVTACVGSLAKCAELRVAIGETLAPWTETLKLRWEHLDFADGSVNTETHVDALIAVPDTHTWSRARHRGPDGSHVLRSRRWQWGLPRVRGKNRDRVEHENNDLRRALKLLNASLTRNPRLTFVLAAPEDRGALGSVHPASIWQLHELRRWSRRHDLRRGAVNQCELALPSKLAPLGILFHACTNGTAHGHTPLHAGWPRHSPRPGCHYIGPLPRTCRCTADHASEELTARDGDTFASAGTARFLAQFVLDPLLRRRRQALALLSDKGSTDQRSSLPGGPAEPAASETTSQKRKPSSADSDSDRTWPEPPSEEETHAVQHGYLDMQLMRDLDLADDKEDRSFNDISTRTNPSEHRSVRSGGC